MSKEANIRVVAAVIEDEAGRLLVCQRASHKRHGDMWEFPGGKIEPGETTLSAAQRELREELGIEVRAVGALLFSVRDPGSPFVIEFYQVMATGKPAPTEHSAVSWMKKEDLLSLPLAPSDERFARTLVTEKQC